MSALVPPGAPRQTAPRGTAPFKPGVVVEFLFYGGVHRATVSHVYLIDASRDDWRFTGQAANGMVYAQINAGRAVVISDGDD